MKRKNALSTLMLSLFTLTTIAINTSNVDANIRRILVQDPGIDMENIIGIAAAINGVSPGEVTAAM